MKISFAAPDLPSTGVVVVAVLADRELGPSARTLDAQLKGGLVRAIEASRFSGKKDQTLSLLAPVGSGYERVLLVGFGKAGELDALETAGHRRRDRRGARRQRSHARRSLRSTPSKAHRSLPPRWRRKWLSACSFAHTASTSTSPSRRKRTSRRWPRWFSAAPTPTARAGCFEPKEQVVDAVVFTRDLVSEPANVVHPESFADSARKLDSLGLEIDVLGEKEMKRLGMNALLAVGQGSEQESQLVVLQWWGLGKPGEKSDDRKKQKDEEKGAGRR